MIRAVEPKMSPEEFAEVIAAFEDSKIGKTIFGHGRSEGVGKGLGPVERQFARRLGRPITAAEHAELLRRLDTLGPERIGDVVLDLAPAAPPPRWGLPTLSSAPRWEPAGSLRPAGPCGSERDTTRCQYVSTWSLPSARIASRRCSHESPWTRHTSARASSTPCSIALWPHT